jgi:hypothetical protein
LPAKYRDSVRIGVIFVVIALVVLVSAGCAPRQIPQPTPTQPPAMPTAAATATPTPSHEDPYEPNDSTSQAFGPLDPAHEYHAYISGENDADFFYFEIEAPKRVSIALSDIPAGVDYDLYLITGEQDILDSSASSGETDEHIEYITSSVGVFYIAVLPFRHFSETDSYTLRVTFSPAPTPSGSDNYEPNDSFEQAAGPLAIGQTYQAYIWDEGDKDNYLLRVDQTGLLAIDLTHIPATADYDLFLYDDAAQLLASSKTVLDHEHIEQYLQSGIYYICVQSYTGFSWNEPYGLQVTAPGG